MNKNIQSVEEKKGAKGVYLKVTWDDGKADNIFKKEHMDVIRTAQKENLTVAVAKEKQGDYWNVTSVVFPDIFADKRGTPETPSAEPVAKSSKGKDDFTPIRAKATNRSDALRISADMVIAGKVEPGKIYEAADKYLEYIEKE